MKAHDGDLTILSGRNFLWCRLYQITLFDGSNLFYTSGDTNVLYGGNTYICGKGGGALFETKGKKGQIKWKLGLQVDTLDYDVMPGNATIKGQPFTQAIQQGWLDGSVLTVSNAYWRQGAWSTPIVPGLVVKKWVGLSSTAKADRSKINFTSKSHLALLNQNLPRNIYQSGCMNTLYDSACTLVASSFAVAGTVASGSTGILLNATIANATGYFDLGKITFTSGANSGLSRGVRTYVNGSPGTILLNSSLPLVPAPGDTFNIYPGCDKTRATCIAKFSNLVNFRGFPDIPENNTGV